MFEIALLQICLLSAPACLTLTDDWGPYKTEEICETRIDFILDHRTRGIDTYGYRAYCQEVGVDGEPIGPMKQYIREGDSFQKPNLGDPI